MSENSLEGKSYLIEQMAKENDEMVFNLSLLGEFCHLSLTKLLKKLQVELIKAKNLRAKDDPKNPLPKRNALKINIEIERECLEEVIMIGQTLDKIIYDECIEVDEGYLSFSNFFHIYIEVGGMYQHFLLENLCIVNSIENKDFWQKQSIKVLKSINPAETVPAIQSGDKF